MVVSENMVTFASMNIQELLNRTDRFAANAGCRITEVDTEHAVAEMMVTKEHLNHGDWSLIHS